MKTNKKFTKTIVFFLCGFFFKIYLLNNYIQLAALYYSENKIYHFRI